MADMQWNNESFSRFLGGAAKAAMPRAVIDTFEGGGGTVTLANGQVFGFSVEELEQVAEGEA